MKIKLDKNAFVPERAHETDAGLDLKSPIKVTIYAHDSAVDTGVHVHFKPLGATKKKRRKKK